MAFGLMLIAVGLLGSFYDKAELLEVTGGSGLTIYLIWAGILSSVFVIRYLHNKWN